MSLKALLAARIAAQGPITLADYMADCLLHPSYGYYATRDPFGAAGDFTTAPEISQMFGELLGLALAQCWLDQGAPAPFTLAELGPGRGTLMADLLRATRGIPGFHVAMRLHLVEASPVLRAGQRAAIAPHPARWLDTADQLPDQALFLIANEFFDALPIRQFTRDAQGWCETRVGVTDGRLTPGLTAATPFPPLDHRLHDTRPGDIVEICPAATATVATIGQRIARHGGVALIVDYGGWISHGDTFQAVAAHSHVDPFADPGQADLTAHVDFAALAAASPTAHVYTTQGEALLRLGIAQRTAALGRNLPPDGLAGLQADSHRLTAPSEMGTLFKLLALHPAGSPAPPGTV